MNFTWEEYQIAYKKAPQAIKEVVDSQELSDLCDQIIQAHHLSDNSFSLIMGMLSRVILGIIKPAENNTALLESLTISNTLKTNLIKNINQSALAILNKAEPDFSSKPQPVPTLTPDIIEAEAALQHVSTVRTMARDMHDLESQAPHEPNTHYSTQAAALNRTPTPVVPTTPAPQPRWESAS